ncbi:MAG: hypothetical protein C0501_14685 [Isosphaera sp.]|nr:hypothetical protein [Isosphaera sp.]
MDGAEGPPPKYRVGDKIKIHWGTTLVIGEVTEDRGPLGVGGRRLYGVRFTLTDDEPSYIELPEVEMEPAT